MRRVVLAFILIFILSKCEQPLIYNPADVAKYPAVFMYSTGSGELRLLNIEYKDNDTTYQVERFGNIGTPTSFFGEADNDWYNTYDISRFVNGDSIPKAVAALRKYNTIDPAYNKLYIKQVVGINQSRRISTLQFFSDINKRYQSLAHWNYPIPGERGVKFIDNNSYVVLYTDQYEEIPGVTKPIDVPYSGKVINLIKFSFTSTNQDLGEIITNFSIGDNRADVYKDKPTNGTVNHLHVSANGQFFIVWAPFYASIPFSPYIIRGDGTMAFNPVLVHWSFSDRFFGQQMFAFEPSSTKDSVFAIGDAGYKQIKIVQLPPTIGSRFIELKTKTLTQLFPQSSSTSWATLQRQRSFFMKFNKAGNKLAISHAMPNVEPSLVIWNTDADTLRRYLVNQPGESINYTFMGKPAWAYNSNGGNLVYFMAADTSGATPVADLFYVDSRSTSKYARKINWSRVEFRSGIYEDLTSATDLVGR
jgi:hypothetical protein